MLHPSRRDNHPPCSSGARAEGRPAQRRSRRAGRRGFTLIETALAVIIIGVGVLAMIDAQNAFTLSNRWSSRAATASYLAGEIRELTRHLPKHDPVTGLEVNGGVLTGWGPESGEVTVFDYNDLDDFDGARFGDGGDLPGPVSGFGDVIGELAPNGSVLLDENGLIIPMRGWSQTVLVEKLDPWDTSIVVPDAAKVDAEDGVPARGPGQYPLRVTVIIEFREPNALDAEEVTRVSWIVP